MKIYFNKKLIVENFRIYGSTVNNTATEMNAQCNRDAPPLVKVLLLTLTP